ncbi:IclR family transcriptional regulator [Dethiosulfatarculus sandiegensis]|uniref:IclR family transcriptional regulator n=1 Tax=Dethiosulfatarculus sandiegensis TaxID=1429043 RepID=A0A0D2HUZ0_9BACT|nr:IclR family transcriptional regulator C-terminal domain-containing protein [Dethiosulfatarculus sandiegensis]KIX14233.1 IclR family transcriptional regulator [Dethiosulfatarculus sandiegensis]
MLEHPPGKNFIRALANGLTCLTTFSPEKPALTLSEVAKKNGMNLVTARRYLLTLKELGYVHFDEQGKTYRLTPRVLRLGSWIIESMDLRTRMLPYLTHLTREWHVTSGCAILEGQEVVYLERIRSNDVVNLDLTAGSRLPVHCTSMGKVIMAFLPPHKRADLLERIKLMPYTLNTITDKTVLKKQLDQVRLMGYASSDQELTLGLRCLAVPLFDKSGLIEAALQVSYRTEREDASSLPQGILPELLKISRETKAGVAA